ncbi:CRISPR-associated protein Cas5 [Acidobacteria bacterium ACD]|nr:MAG: CRISPR-associated protein Cas5 [Acidobacteriota bacterium]MCE7958219.1 CRISPR-associated protein Cas5 [Acidobacteria bacterium ACB2]MDL1948788.1 CRISPR-associated protein Cas5 [Acidobacteria bacterium ACD]
MWLRARAPFAAFRGLQAGVYRATAPVLPPSAAWGLVLNLAGYETRGPLDRPVTGLREGLPVLRIALGEVTRPEVFSLYQQLHSYPVGTSGSGLRPRTKGAKYWIAPVRREFLSGLDAVIGVETDDPALPARVRRGLAGAGEWPRYGLPFAGDNNLLFDSIEVLDVPVPCRWYSRLGPDDQPGPVTCRMTVGIDREESSRTSSAVFGLGREPTTEPPESAWTWTPRVPAGRRS